MQEQMTKQDAIETLEIFRNDYTREGSAMCRAIDIALDALRQPTIKAEPVKHGVWLEKVDDFHSNIPMRYSECSVCGRTENPCWAESWKYCPSCGARMDLRTPAEVQLDEADSVMMGGADNG